VDLGGMTVEQAALELSSAPSLAGAAADSIVLHDPGDAADPADDRSWSLSKASLGRGLDPVALAEAAYALGRGGLPLAGWLRGADLDVVDRVDQDLLRRALQALAPEVDVAPVDGDVRWEDGEVIVVEPVYGRQLDVAATASAVVEALAAGRSDVAIVTQGTAPRFSDARSVGDALERIQSGPVQLRWREGQRYTAAVDDIGQWVSLERIENEFGDVVPSIVFDEAAVGAWIGTFAEDIDRPVENARFEYDRASGKLEVLEKATTGQELDVRASVRRFIDAAYSEVRIGELAVREIRPTVSEDMAATISGTVRPVFTASSRVANQPGGRVQNMLLASERLHGTALAAGDEFSFRDQLGPVNADAGYDMVQVESGAPMLGGGLEQVASGAFRAALWVGVPITERHTPVARLAWAEPPIGLDAAVDDRGRDLRFVNDTDGYMIMDVSIDAELGTLAWSIVAVPQERRVALEGPLVSGIVPAGPPSVVRDERWPAGRSEAVGWAREGADVAWERVVYDDAGEVRRDALAARYEPSGDVTVVGTGGS
jgi:vancomycin resistance protein YoaR